MITWNDIFVERLFNGGKYVNGMFQLPEGCGKSENYSRVIDLYRAIYQTFADCSFPDYGVVLQVSQGDNESCVWGLLKRDDRTLLVTGDSPEDAVGKFITLYGRGLL